jgi:hypothetical protein
MNGKAGKGKSYKFEYGLIRTENFNITRGTGFLNLYTQGHVRCLYKTTVSTRDTLTHVITFMIKNGTLKQITPERPPADSSFSEFIF